MRRMIPGSSLFLILLFSLSFSQDSLSSGDALLEATENCGINVSGDQWFSLALVKLLADSVINVGKENQDAEFVFIHHGTKKTKVSYNGKTKRFVVTRNYVPPPVKGKMRDPATGKIVEVEWE